MSTQINTSYNNYDPAKSTAAASTAAMTKVPENESEAIKKEAAANTAAPKDSYEKSEMLYTPDMDKVKSMKADLNKNIGAFRQMVETLFNKQGNFSNNLYEKLQSLHVDEETRLEAEQLVSDEGYWGVEQTATRILDFAKALSGGDPSKIELLKGAVNAGFDAAKKAFGGEMPEITEKTYEKVMEGFDKWEASGKASADEQEGVIDTSEN